MSTLAKRMIGESARPLGVNPDSTQVIQLVHDYAFKAKSSQDPALKQTTLVTISSFTGEWLKTNVSEASNNKLNPEYGVADRPGVGDSSEVPSHTKKEGEEFQPTGEERREVALADKILTAAQRMAKNPDVEEIIRYADELKKMHGNA